MGSEKFISFSNLTLKTQTPQWLLLQQFVDKGITSTFQYTFTTIIPIILLQKDYEDILVQKGNT